MNKDKILVVDDKMELILLVEIVLGSAGYNVVGLGNSVETVETAIKEKPSLIILDLMMPKMDGWEVFNTLKSNPATADIPIIILSVKAERDEVERSAKFGVDGLMKKPFDPEKLIELVNKILTEKK